MSIQTLIFQYNHSPPLLTLPGFVWEVFALFRVFCFVSSLPFYRARSVLGREPFCLPLTNIFWRPWREKGVNWCLLWCVVSCFEFLSCAVMGSDTDDICVTEENAEQTGLSRVAKKKETDILLLQIKKRKRCDKTKATKLWHELERVCLRDSELSVIESALIG